MTTTKTAKPLGKPAYGSIGHLPTSRLGAGDHSVPQGQADICTTKARRGDLVRVEEKLDGSCCSVANIGGEIHALTRSGYPASTSPYEQHHMFHRWAMAKRDAFKHALPEGYRFVGEWMAQAHGTIYDVTHEFYPFFVFDLMTGTDRAPVDSRGDAVGQCGDGDIAEPLSVLTDQPITVEEAMQRIERYAGRDVEGVVYRVENGVKFDFAAKWVRHDKIDGQYLPQISGRPAVWHFKVDRYGEIQMQEQEQPQ